MKKIWHPFKLWEEYHFGMWRKRTLEEEAELLRKAIAFTGDHVLYGSFMQRVAQEWRFSCEHNLTDSSLNRRAWIGHAAASLAINAPEHITRQAWWYLSDRQRDLANAEADTAIALWEAQWDDSVRALTSS